MYAYHKIIGVPIHAVNFSLSLTKDYIECHIGKFVA